MNGRIWLSKRRRAQRAAARKREDARWAARSGPVTARRAGDCPRCGTTASRAAVLRGDGGGATAWCSLCNDYFRVAL